MMDISTVPCTQCRKRRVKCDKRLPGCLRCEKSSHPCPGYNRLRKFLDQGDNLRRKFSGTSSPRIDESNSTLLSPIAPHASPDSNSQFSAPVIQSINPPQDDNIQHPPLGESENAAGGHSHIPIDTHLVTENLLDSDFEATFFDIDPEIYYAEGNNCCGFVPFTPLATSIDDSPDTSLSWFTYISPENLSQPSVGSERATPNQESLGAATDSPDETEHETAYLLRYFAEHISPSLDVFDVERYFGHVVPIKAARSALLKNSLAAIAAKQFGKTKREGTSTNNQTVSGTLLEQHCHGQHVNWFYKAASFYDKAIGHMMRSLQTLRNGNSPAPPSQMPSPNESPSSNNATVHSTAAPSSFKRRRIEQNHSPIDIVNDLLAATSVFLFYELLDNRRTEMLQHMSGAQNLLLSNLNDLIDNGGSGSRSTQRNFDAKRGWQASFWNLACIDYIASYSEQTVPRLDLDNPHLWEAAGLPMRELDGKYFPASLCKDNDPATREQMTETMACRTLIWILLKTLTYVVAKKNETITGSHALFQASTSSLISTTWSEYWHDIRQHLEDWGAALPDTFEPCMRLSQPSMGTITSTTSALSPFPQLFYSNSMCATAVILYHFVQTLLLLYKPLNPDASEPHSRFVSKRLDAYRQLASQIDDHASEICAISLSHPKNSVRLHMVQPLHLAGLCFEADDKRAILIDLLMSIQHETGYSTHCRVVNLREEWERGTCPTND